MKPPSSPFLRSIYEYMMVSRYSNRTIETYLYWIRFFINFNGKEHPLKLDGNHIEQFLTFLAVQRKVSSATQRLALNAIAFLYNKYLDKPMGEVGNFRRSRVQAKLPVVLTKTEVRCLLSHLSGPSLLLASILYGSGLRRIEAVRLRVRDVDFDQQQLRIWFGKGFKHRITTLAPELLPALRLQIRTVQEQLGHQDVKTTEIYTHVLKRGARGVRSPLSDISN